jgi:D-alanine-D-alanine ligase
VKRRLNILVMAGGASAEREVSLRSGAAVARALRSLDHGVTQMDPQDDRWTVPAGIEVVFLALHGTYGEDGTVQRRLDEMGMLYTGCDAESSRIAFDKLETKRRCVAAGVSTPRFTVVRSARAGFPLGWQPPLVVKPVRQGSSVGLRFVDQVEDWREAVAATLLHDSEALVEERVLGRETTVGILAGEALPVVEIRPLDGGYNYENKYTPGATEYSCPAAFDRVTTERLQELALRAFDAVGGRDYGRVDMMVGGDGQPLVLEVNTLPGMTETSLLPKAALAAGIQFADLCQRMVALALDRAAKEQA